MKRRILAAALTLCLTMSLVPTAAFAVGGKSFDDVNGHWGQASVERWAGYGVFNGDDAGNFNPDKQMTRAEFATMLANMMGYTAKADKSFGDVASDAWYADAILKLAAAGVMLGDNNGNANPNKPISRAEAAVMMCRAFNIQPSNASLNFADSANVADWARGSMAALAEKGMMNGVGNNQLAPLANITRASVAKLVDNMISEYVTESKTISGDVKGIVLVVGDVDVTVKDATLSENLIVAPKAAGAEVVLTGSTKASDVYVDAAANVKVDAQATAGDVQLSAPKAAAEVAGKVDTVATTAAAADAAVTVAKDAAVSKVEVAAPNTNLNVAGKVDTVNVASSATGAEVKTESSAAISNVTTSATDVKVSGTGKVENVTANSGTVAVTTPGTKVENKTDSADNVTANGKPVPPSSGGTTTPSKPSGGGGGGGGGSSYAYNVSIPSNITGGTVTASIAGEAAGTTGTNTEGKSVTLTVTPNAQDGSTMPYILKEGSLKVTLNGEDVTVSDNTFTMTEAGTYTVAVEFVQPITDAEVFIANDAASLAKMISYGYPEGDTDAEKLAANPYLVIGVKRALGDAETAANRTEITGVSLTANGASVTLPDGWKTSESYKFKYATAYVGNEKHSSDPNDPADMLSLTGSAYTFELTFKYMGANYTLNCEYTKPGVTPDSLKTVTFKTSDGTVIATYKGTKGETVQVPAAPSVDGSYFTGWNTEGVISGQNYTIGDDDVTIIANYIEICAQELQTRPNGPATSGTSDFNYGEAYKTFGVTLTSAPEKYTYTINAGTFLTNAAKNENTSALSNLAATVGDNTYYFYGAAIMAPTDAAKMVITKDSSVASLDVSKNYSEYVVTGDGKSEHAFEIDGKNCILHYFGAVAAKAKDSNVYGFQPDGTFVRYVKWLKNDDSIISVNKITLERKTTDIPECTVTFDSDGGSDVAAQTVIYGEKATSPTAPTKDGFTFSKWVIVGENDEETEFSFDTLISGNIALKATWTSNNGGTEAGGNSSENQNENTTTPTA